MQKILVSLGAAAALLLSSTAVRADPIVTFGYSASAAVNPNVLPGDDPSIIYNTNNSMKTSSIKFTPPAAGTASYDLGSNPPLPSQFIIYNMNLTSSATAGTGTYDNFGTAANPVPLNFAITLTDPSNATKTFNFLATYTASNVSSTSSYVDPTSQGFTWTNGKSITQTIGSNVYTLTIVSATSSAAPGSPGAIMAEVTIGTSGSGQPPPSSPEPTSLVLAGLALPALLLARRRQKKAVAA